MLKKEVKEMSFNRLSDRGPHFMHDQIVSAGAKLFPAAVGTGTTVVAYDKFIQPAPAYSPAHGPEIFGLSLSLWCIIVPAFLTSVYTVYQIYCLYRKNQENKKNG